jgi:hypothetical protein
VTGSTVGELSISGWWVLVVVLVSIAVALVYGELVSRVAVRQALTARGPRGRSGTRVTVQELRERENAVGVAYDPSPRRRPGSS